MPVTLRRPSNKPSRQGAATLPGMRLRQDKRDLSAAIPRGTRRPAPSVSRELSSRQRIFQLYLNIRRWQINVSVNISYYMGVLFHDGKMAIVTITTLHKGVRLSRLGDPQIIKLLFHRRGSHARARIWRNSAIDKLLNYLAGSIRRQRAVSHPDRCPFLAEFSRRHNSQTRERIPPGRNGMAAGRPRC